MPREDTKILDSTTLLVGHNIKFDLTWLLESNFKYNGRVYDTMIGEYVLARGLRKGLSLDASCKRRKIGMKDKRIEEFVDRGVSFENIPVDLVEEYGRQDVTITRKLFNSQMGDFKLKRIKVWLKQLR